MSVTPSPTLSTFGSGLLRRTQALEVLEDGLVHFIFVAFDRDDLIGSGLLDEAGDDRMAAHDFNQL